MFPEDPPEAYEDFFTEYCKTYQATPEQITQYKNEQDPTRRLELAYEYNLGIEDLFEEDFLIIMDDVNAALREAELEDLNIYKGIRSMGDL